MQIMGNVVGFGVGAIAVATGQFALGLLALGILELVTMLSVVIRVDDGRPPLPREGKSWLTIAKSAWGTDILKERSYVWLVASRCSSSWPARCSSRTSSRTCIARRASPRRTRADRRSSSSSSSRSAT